MKNGRYKFSLIKHKNFVYALGGLLSEKFSLNLCERFNL